MKLKIICMLFLAILCFTCNSQNTGEQTEELNSEEESGIQENQDSDMLRLTGTINQIFKFKGTLSEYSYFVLYTAVTSLIK